MSIIITELGQKPLRIDPSDFENESSLQKLIHDSPETIPLYEIKDDVKLLVLAREWPTESGPIDALGVDRDGDIYIIETKLRKNPDKRDVVAQALDYGAALWRHAPATAELEAMFDASIRAKFNVGFREKLTEFFVLDEAGTDGLMSNVSRNLNDGKFKFVIPMDRVHDRLKDLIVFLNQNSRFDIYAVELECYKLDERTIIIPKLFGGEVKKAVDAAGPATRRTWTEAEVLAEAKERMSGTGLAEFSRMYEFCKSSADELKFGVGAHGTANFTFGKLTSARSAVMLATDGRLNVNFDWFRDDAPDACLKIKEGLEKCGLKFSPTWNHERPGFVIEDWGPKTEAIIGVLDGVLKGQS